MKRLIPLAALLLAVAALGALGVWQVERRAWKHALIARVNCRLADAPVAAPGPPLWPRIGQHEAYRRVIVRGILRRDRQTFVQAVTAYGPGYWAMAPLMADRGFTVLINRGFVPPEERKRMAARAEPRVPATISGLLRVSEPDGGFLRANRPDEDRWYSRDTAAIAARHSLGRVAPYFIDADARPGETWPKGGLTIVSFPDHHLQYAITWFVMAAALAVAGLRMALRRPRD